MLPYLVLVDAFIQARVITIVFFVSLPTLRIFKILLEVYIIAQPEGEQYKPEHRFLQWAIKATAHENKNENETKQV